MFSDSAIDQALRLLYKECDLLIFRFVGIRPNQTAVLAKLSQERCEWCSAEGARIPAFGRTDAMKLPAADGRIIQRDKNVLY
jgi:hypothetical protein